MSTKQLVPTVCRHASSASVRKNSRHQCATRLCFFSNPACGRIWQLHWIHPLFNCSAAHGARKNRGVHLAPIIAKVIEKHIGMVFVPFLDKTDAFGRSQWAFRPGCGCRDLVTMKLAKWIWDINGGNRVGLFL